MDFSLVAKVLSEEEEEVSSEEITSNRTAYLEALLEEDSLEDNKLSKTQDWEVPMVFLVNRNLPLLGYSEVTPQTRDYQCSNLH